MGQRKGYRQSKAHIKNRMSSLRNTLERKMKDSSARVAYASNFHTPKGSKQSRELIEKRSISMLGKNRGKKRPDLAERNKHMTERHLAKIRAAMRTDKTRNLISQRRKEDWKNSEYRAKVKKGIELAWSTPEAHIRASEVTTKSWEKHTSLQREERIRAAFKGAGIKPNKAEVKLDTFLSTRFPNEWKYVGDGNLIIGGKCPDFANTNGKKALIELFGTYWHRNDNPQNRIEHFARYGYKCLIIWEHELKEKEVIASRIMETFS